ncbi:MAG TPA: lysylphosphatidylglycerol synthase transmembrane domain-containing protein [Acidobacteriota bacterium]|nr:lysylphosphatidylglycerol synthase transmembrane domain-containing protein [Acidobacteriota bacterium]
MKVLPAPQLEECTPPRDDTVAQAPVGGSAAPRSRLRSTLLRGLVSFSLLGFFLLQMDWGEFLRILGEARWSLIFLAVLLHALTVLPSVTRWRSIVRPFGMQTPWSGLFRICMIGYFFNLLLPSAIGGDLARAYYLSRRERSGFTCCLICTAVDRLAGLFAMVLIALTANFIWPARVGPWPASLLLSALAGGFLIITLSVFHPWFHRLWERLLVRMGLSSALDRFQLISEGLQRLRHNVRAVAVVVGSSLVIQFTVIVALWLVARSIGVEGPFSLFLVFIPLVNLSVAIPLTINGMGVRELMYLFLFSQLGVGMETAVMLSWLNLLVVAGTALPGGLVYSFYKGTPDFPETDFGRLTDAPSHDSA